MAAGSTQTTEHLLQIALSNVAFPDWKDELFNNSSFQSGIFHQESDPKSLDEVPVLLSYAKKPRKPRSRALFEVDIIAI